VGNSQEDLYTAIRQFVGKTPSPKLTVLEVELEEALYCQEMDGLDQQERPSWVTQNVLLGREEY